jgi:hypothetical protein
LEQRTTVLSSNLPELNWMETSSLTIHSEFWGRKMWSWVL